MSTVQNGERQSLPQLYKLLRKRLKDAHVQALALYPDFYDTGPAVHESEECLNFWAKEIGVHRNVLEELEAAKGALCEEMQNDLFELHMAIEHIEFKVRRRSAIGDGSRPRADAVQYFYNLVNTLRSKTGKFSEFAAQQTQSRANAASSPSATQSSSTPTASRTPLASSSSPTPESALQPSSALLEESLAPLKSEGNADGMDVDPQDRSHLRKDSHIAPQAPQVKMEDMLIDPIQLVDSSPNLSPNATSLDISELPTQLSPPMWSLSQSPMATYIQNTPSTLSITLSPITPVSSTFSSTQYPPLFADPLEERKIAHERWENTTLNPNPNPIVMNVSTSVSSPPSGFTPTLPPPSTLEPTVSAFPPSSRYSFPNPGLSPSPPRRSDT